MKKGNTAIIGVVIVIVLAVGGYMIFHKPKKATPSTSTSSSSAAAVNNAVLTTKTDSKVGQYLANSSGMALYTYGGDSSGVSTCTGSCLANWPAYQDTGATMGLPTGVSTIKRTDNGQTQYTYNGMPLYTFAGDSSGNVTGNGVDNFSLAMPAAASTPSTTTNSNSTNTTSGSGSSNY
jgi:predicted lipoprotein with Yx(FWY)xxD motif